MEIQLSMRLEVIHMPTAEMRLRAAWMSGSAHEPLDCAGRSPVIRTDETNSSPAM